jgi:hypothetical protein
MKSYFEIKFFINRTIKKIKLQNKELGIYLEKHIYFDDLNETVKYTGENLLD